MRFKRQMLLTSLSLAVFVTVGLMACTASTESTARKVPVAPYQVNAAGAPAVVAERWLIRFSPGHPVGIITGIARCGDAAYLVDVREAAVYHVDLARKTMVGQVGGRGELVEPRAITADCGADRLYVIDWHAVVVYRLSDGAWVRTYKLPPGVSIRGRVATVTRDHRELYLSALWEPARDFSRTYPQDALFKGARLGLRLSLENGAAEPVVDAFEPGCRGYADGCWKTSVAVAEGPQGRRWVVSQGLSRNLVLYGPGKSDRRTVDIASPLFKSDGRALARGADRDAQSAWSSENSDIEGTVVFGETIVAVHGHVNRTRRDQGLADFTVLMNLYSMSGAPLASDIGLPGFPLGFDHDSLYVVDYGAGGRRADVSSVDMVRIVPGFRSFQSR